jgi:cytochrome c oxidase subunit 2
MKVDLYERIWMWLGSLMILGFLAAMMVSAATHAVHPPSHMETIDPALVASDPDFSRPRVETAADGSVRVVGTTQLYSFRPNLIRVAAGKKITFRLTSPDVVHGFQIVGTNANAMVVPGYVTQLTTTFERKGEYLIVCNEYCGLSHHLMQARMIVE